MYHGLPELLIRPRDLSMKPKLPIPCLFVVPRTVVIQHMRNLIRIIIRTYVLHSFMSQTQFCPGCILILFIMSNNRFSWKRWNIISISQTDFSFYMTNYVTIIMFCLQIFLQCHLFYRIS